MASSPRQEPQIWKTAQALCKTVHVIPSVEVIEVARVLDVFAPNMTLPRLCARVQEAVKASAERDPDELDQLLAVADGKLRVIEAIGARIVRGQDIYKLFRATKKLGAGGYGSVYEATLLQPIRAGASTAPGGPTGITKGVDLPAATRVALKTVGLNELPPEWAESAALELNAVRRAMERGCPHVNQIYQVLYNPDDNVLFFVLRLVQGMDLYELVLEQKDPTFMRISAYADALARGKSDATTLKPGTEKVLRENYVMPLRKGLQCLHQNGLTHRDIKVISDSKPNVVSAAN